MFDNSFLSLEEAKERVRKRVKDPEDYELYKQPDYGDGVRAWVIVLLLIVAALLIW